MPEFIPLCHATRTMTAMTGSRLVILTSKTTVASAATVMVLLTTKINT